MSTAAGLYSGGYEVLQNGFVDSRDDNAAAAAGGCGYVDI